MQKINKIQELENIIDQFKFSNTLSNNFMLQEEVLNHINMGVLYYMKGTENAYLFLKKNGFYRLYFYLNDLDESIGIENSDPIVQELIYRGDKFYPKDEIQFWRKNGFKPHLVRECYFLKPVDAQDSLRNFNLPNGVTVRNIISPEDIQGANDMIKEYLDPYTGDILSIEQLYAFSKRDELIGVYVGSDLAGILQPELKNNVYWLGHIVVKKSFQGKSLSTILLKCYFEKGLNLGIRQFQLWVIADNTSAINLYKKYGFKYLNKSTISLLNNG